MNFLSPQTLPFALHAIVETFAGITFVLRPHSQLPNPSLPTRLVIQSFGGAVLTSVLVALVFAVRPVHDETSRLVAASLAFWHVWPSYRAAARLATGADRGTPQWEAMGGPVSHLSFHAVMTAMFLYTATLSS